MRTNSPGKERTLKIKRPFGRTLTLSFIIIVILSVLLETTARLDSVQSVLPSPTIASGHRRLDLKLFFLDRLVKEEGRVDCIFLGGSDMNAALNPGLFSRVFEEKTGEKLICFNFGLAGFIPQAAALMARILVEKYHPRLLVWGFSPISFGDEFKRKPATIVKQNSWCRYRLGDFNFEGWLTEHSYAYRYFLRFRTWLERPVYARSLSSREGRLSKYGYLPAERTGKFILFKQDEEKEIRYKEILADFDISVKAATALEQVLRLGSRTKVVLVDVPAHPAVLTLHERGAGAYRKALSYVKKRAGQRGVLFLAHDRFDFIPGKGYKDLGHMNTIGAKLFSRWLGRQMAKAAGKGLLSIPGRTGPDSAPTRE